MPHRSKTRFRPRFESLETRLTPTTYTVSSLADSGAGSLRAAITSVNADTTADEIDFSVAGVIKLTSGSLPTITNTVKIDGSTAPGFTTAPVVELNGNGFPEGLIFDADLCTLEDLSIAGNSRESVNLNGNNETVIGNYIGLTLDSTIVPGSNGTGLSINSSQNDTIGGTGAADRNVISGNGFGGILLNPRSPQILQNITIEGNFIGTDPAGKGVGGQGVGIEIGSSGNTIGGTEAGAGNLITSNGEGIDIGVGSGNAILGNSIYDNGGIGIELRNGSNQNQPFPLMAFATQTAATTTVRGIFNAEPDTTYTVQVYMSPAPQNSNSGQLGRQAQTLLETIITTSDASGFAAFTFNSQIATNPEVIFTATETSPSGNTSEISYPVFLSGNANEAYVGSAYALLFNRGEYGSGSFWSDQLNAGASTGQVLLGIQGSAEYLSYQVTAMYQRYLQRSPDTTGEQFWISYLQTGGTFEGMAEDFTSSQEYFDLQGGAHQGFITGLYHDVLNRGASDAEVAGWEAALNSGMSRFTVSTAFLTSQEYRTNLVQADYLRFLVRPADSGGLAAFVDALNAGATDQDVLAAIFGSTEGYQLWS